MIKLLIIKDTVIDYQSQIEEALNLQRQDYLAGTDGELDVSWEIIEQDLSNIEWVEYGYGKGNYGVNRAWLFSDTSFKTQDVYSIAYVVDNSNWTKKGNPIYGWAAGFFNGYQVQLIRGYQNNVDALYRSFLMELIHSFNEYAKARLGVNFNTLFDVPNWDEDVIHARHEDWDLFEYVPVIRKIKDILLQLFKEDMLKVVVDKNKDQWIIGQDGKSRKIVNLPMRKDLIAAGVIEDASPEKVDEVLNPINVEWGLLLGDK